MLDRVQQVFALADGATLTVWKKTAKGKYRACITFANGEVLATGGYEFATMDAARQWAAGKVGECERG